MNPTPSSAKSHVSASVSSTPEGDLLIISGEIDDDSVLSTLADQLVRNPIIDLGGVTFINSVGVREWITLLDRIAQKGLPVTLRNVSEPMVRQMSMVMEVRGDAAVESFYAPYCCPACGDERALLIRVAEHQAALAAQQPPVMPCAACGANAEFDEFPKRYLSFLT